MFYLTLGAIGMMAGGMIWISPMARDNPLVALLYWFACGWVTITTALLALFDLLLVRAALHRERHQLEREIQRKEGQSGKGTGPRTDSTQAGS